MRFRIFLFALLVSTALPSRAAEPSKPNILFILTDDQGWPTLGSYGNKLVPTPHWLPTFFAAAGTPTPSGFLKK